MPSKFHEKIVEPVQHAISEMKGVAEGATAHAAATGEAAPAGTAANLAAQKGLQGLHLENLPESVKNALPENVREYLGMKQPQEATTFGGRAFNFLERNILGRPLVFVAFPLILGLFVSSWVHKKIRSNRAQFDKIAVPKNVPPSWLYDPMWTVALTCMGYASWLIYNQGGFGEWLSLSFYNMSLFLLAAWPFLFFGYPDNQLLPALCSTLLSINSVVTMGLFYAKSGAAGSLMIPAVLWIGYMTILNWQVFGMNKGRQGINLPGIGKGKEESWPWTTPTASGAAAGTTAAGSEAKKTR